MPKKPAPIGEPVIVRPAQAFHLLGIGKTLGFNLIRDGTLPKVRLGGRAIGIPLAAIRALIEGGMTAPQPGPTPEPPTRVIKRPAREKGS